MIFVGIIIAVHMLVAIWATYSTKSSWKLKTVFGKFLLAFVITLLGFCEVFLGGANFPQLQVEVNSSIAIAKRELMTRVYIS